MHNKILTATLLLFISAASLAATPDDELFRAMQDELDRSMAELQLGDLERPYFISYTLTETHSSSAQATLGVLQSSGQMTRRLLNVEVRVGDYDFDNTNFLGPGSYGVTGLAMLALENDYPEMRRQIWLATDAAYKQALESLSQKKAALQNRVRDEEIPDFSRETPLRIEDRRPTANPNKTDIEDLVRSLSGLFRDAPIIFSSQVEMSVNTVTMRYVNSEGSRYLRTTPSAALAAVAGTRAQDGRPVEDAVTAFGQRPDDFPTRPELTAAITTMIERLETVREAPLVERYNGPVLFTGQAAAELFAQRLAPALVATRTPVMENAPGAGMGGEADAGWEDRIGGRVLPRFMTVIDDPTLDSYQDHALASGYQVDDEAVAASPTTLVENGRLRTLLSGRTPVAGIERSSGNARDGSVIPSNMLVTTQNGLTRTALETELFALAQESGEEYGLVVTKIASPAVSVPTGQLFAGAFNGRPGQGVVMAQEAYRLYPDGRREPVRNLELSGVSAASFRDIIAASDELTVHTLPYVARTGMSFGTMLFIRPGSGLMQLPLTSWAVPSLLFEELNGGKPAGEYPSLPIVPRPELGLSSD